MLDDKIIHQSTFRSNDSTRSSSSDYLGGISGLYNKDIGHRYIIEEYKLSNQLQYYPSKYFSVVDSRKQDGEISYKIRVNKDLVKEDITALEIQIGELQKLLQIDEDTKPKI